MLLGSLNGGLSAEAGHSTHVRLTGVGAQQLTDPRLAVYANDAGVVTSNEAAYG